MTRGYPSDLAPEIASLGRPCDDIVRLSKVDFAQEFLESFPVFGQVDRVRRGSENPDSFRLERPRQLQRRLPAKLHDNPEQRSVGTFDPQNLQDVFKCQGFKVKGGQRCHSPY